jgi:Na+-translocating ferredoxin:NAD+ oxidoreductase subunit C
MTDAKSLQKGGVRPPNDSHVSRTSAIANAMVPSRAIIPLLQHSGTAARCVVKPGDTVTEGMLIGRAEGAVCANVHASIPGTVAAVTDITLPDGTASPAVFIDLAGEFAKSGRPLQPRAWEALSGMELLARIQSAGVVGLGGELTPTHLKLTPTPGSAVGLLVATGIDSEPALSADYALSREKTAQIAEALRICRRLLEPRRMVLALDEDAQDLAAAYEAAFAQVKLGCEIAILPSHYPQGHEQLVLSAVGDDGATGRSVILNVATLHAVYEAVVLDKPLIERVLTVAGDPVAQPRNLKVRLGTRLGDLFEECGGLLREPRKIVIGGPMRGIAVSSLDIPVMKGTSGVTVFDGARARARVEWACIRCGMCIEVCPWDLVPTHLCKLIRRGGFRAAHDEGLSRCTECGCCAYACPSHIPLVAVFKDGKKARAGDSDA